MNELSLFTGSGGGIYGTKLLGFKTIGYVEYDDYCQAIIAQRIRDGIFDYAPIFGNIDTFAAEYAQSYQRMVDVITAGFPCQPFSTAGTRRGSQDERNKWPSTISVIRKVQPQWILLENVTGLLGRHGYFGTILKDLAESGYNARWCCISAQGMGAPHKRERLWILANSKSIRLERSDQCSSSKESQRTRVLSEFIRSSSRRSKWWEIESNVGRVADGVADRSHRLKALGNGQVPAVVREAWRHLNENI